MFMYLDPYGLRLRPAEGEILRNIIDPPEALNPKP